MQMAVWSAGDGCNVGGRGGNRHLHDARFCRETVQGAQNYDGRTMKPFKHYFFIPQILAVLIVAPLAWMAADRTPPLILHDGVITPREVRPNQTGVTLVWRAHYSGRDCQGLSQREFISDGRRDIFPQLAAQRAGVFQPSKSDPMEGTVTVPSLSIPDMPAGPGSYQVTQFYYCNILQELLHWPIIQRSPYVRFEVVR